jgi:hypothetical protein
MSHCITLSSNDILNKKISWDTGSDSLQGEISHITTEDDRRIGIGEIFMDYSGTFMRVKDFVVSFTQIKISNIRIIQNLFENPHVYSVLIENEGKNYYANSKDRVAQFNINKYPSDIYITCTPGIWCHDMNMGG